MKKASLDEKIVAALLQAIKNYPGSSTTEIAKISGYETSDSLGGHQNWSVHDILKYLEAKGKIEDRRIHKNRGVLCKWYLLK